VLDDAGFALVLRTSVTISFRYNVIGDRATGDQETVYGAVVRTILDGGPRSASAIIRALAPIYPSDAEFREAFAAKSIRTTVTRNARIVKYILGKLEARLSGTEVDVESSTVTIEHVFPQNAQDGWEAFPERDAEGFIYRLGNMTLMEVGRNRDLGAAAYDVKREVYGASTYALTRRIAEENDDWTPERVEQRQRWMANQATAIWRVDQLA
jgi:hypothetical protein